MFIAGAHTFATGVKVALVLGASACAFDLARRESRDPGSPVPIVCSIAALFTVAVVFPPQFSHDLWSYAIAGRMAAVHHASPYLHAAKEFRHDPLLSLVGREWRSGTTPYGPLFTLYSAGVALLGGSHPILYRLAYQGAAAVAIGFALLFLWRRTRSTSALVLLGLHPVIACAVVNGGHNDAFIGLGVLVAVLCTQRARYTSAGWWITGAILVKATAGLALLPLLGWSWVRGGHRALARIVAAPLLVAAPVMLFTPGMMHSLNSAKTNVITRTSIWNLPLRLLPNVFAPGQHARVAHLVTLALLVVLILVAFARLGREPAARSRAGRRRGDCRVARVQRVRLALVHGVGAPGRGVAPPQPAHVARHDPGRCDHRGVRDSASVAAGPRPRERHRATGVADPARGDVRVGDRAPVPSGYCRSNQSHLHGVIVSNGPANVGRRLRGRHVRVRSPTTGASALGNLERVVVEPAHGDPARPGAPSARHQAGSARKRPHARDARVPRQVTAVVGGGPGSIPSPPSGPRDSSTIT